MLVFSTLELFRFQQPGAHYTHSYTARVDFTPDERTLETGARKGGRPGVLGPSWRDARLWTCQKANEARVTRFES